MAAQGLTLPAPRRGRTEEGRVHARDLAAGSRLSEKPWALSVPTPPPTRFPSQGSRGKLSWPTLGPGSHSAGHGQPLRPDGTPQRGPPPCTRPEREDQAPPWVLVA